MPLSPKKIGDITVSVVLTQLLKAGFFVLLPFGDSLRYDLVVEKDNRFERVQCKTGRLREGCIIFNVASNEWYKGFRSKSYEGQIDYFGVYCQQNGKSYLVPVDQVGHTKAKLRLEPSKNSQSKKIRWAKDFEI